MTPGRSVDAAWLPGIRRCFTAVTFEGLGAQGDTRRRRGGDLR